MRIPLHTLLPGIALCTSLFVPVRAPAQLDRTFSDVFTEILDVRLRRSGSPGEHGTHFLESAERANTELVPALNALIAGNVASFPLSTTGTGALFDFSTGEPVRIAQSPGPIFAETAKPLGRGRILVQASYTFLDMDHFRGNPVDGMRFTFTHRDVTSNGALGDSPNESDLIDLDLDLHARAGIGVIVATYGITNALDISVAVPLISVQLTGTATASIDSYTFGRLGHANHLFGGDTLNPVLSTQVPYNKRATGIGDVALRAKWGVARGGAMDFAVLVDLRLPSGKKENYLGTGKMSIRAWGILSKQMGDVTPHVNLGYALRSAALQSDAIEFRAGFDTKALASFAFALDIMGQIDVNPAKAIHLAPGNITVGDLVAGGGRVLRSVPLSNIPDRKNDNTLSLSAGLRFSPSETLNFFGNILVPLNDGGLRATVAPTLGLSLNL